MGENSIEKFIDQIKLAIEAKNLVKIKINKPTVNTEIKEISIRPVVIKNISKFQFVYSYQKKDITKNLLIDEGVEKIQEVLQKFCIIHYRKGCTLVVY